MRSMVGGESSSADVLGFVVECRMRCSLVARMQRSEIRDRRQASADERRPYAAFSRTRSSSNAKRSCAASSSGSASVICGKIAR
jgi:hypothetical protein